MAGSARAGIRSRARERLARVVRRVLAWEGARAARAARVDVTLLDARAMRRLNRRATGRRGLTDVIAFALPQPEGTVIGDVYICPAARRWTATTDQERRKTLGVDEEIVRLTIHGTLHVLGYDHPDGPGRTRCAMWRRQERYVRRLLDRGRRKGGGG